MIRRNFIQTRSKIDRQALRATSNHSHQYTSSSKPSSTQAQGDPYQDQNVWMRSNKGKYPQYKLQRQQRPKIQEFKVELKPTSHTIQAKQHDYQLKESNLLRRQYAYDLADTLKIDYNSITLKPQRYTQLQSNHYQNNQISKMQSNNDIKYTQNPLDSTVALSPSKKYLLPKKYTPLFQQNHHIKIRESELQAEVQSNKGRSSQIMKKSNEHHRNYSNFRTTNDGDSQLQQSRNKPHSSLITEKQQPLKPLFDVPALPPTYHKQQVSQKLKMISQFNDQINERIKNIIGCFQGLKNKL